MRAVASIAKHRKESHVSLDQHVRACRNGLAKSLSDRRAVYLDSRYWILLREASLGREAQPVIKELLELLRTQVYGGQTFCPISEAVFAELMKQEDLRTRRATAALIDDLSLGTTLAPQDERIGTELAHFLYACRGQRALDPVCCLVWSKLSYVLGLFHPTDRGFGPSTDLAIQKAFFDHMWEMPLVTVVDRLSLVPAPPRHDFSQLTHRLNTGNHQHAHELRSFAQTYDIEVEGVISLYTKVFIQILEKMFEEETGEPSQLNSQRRIEYEQMAENILVSTFNKRRLIEQLPTLHVIASCHAAVRWNRGRRFKENDLLDFNHAAAALSYCDAFFTERSLQVLATKGPLTLDKELGCEVVSDVHEAVELLKSYDR